MWWGRFVALCRARHAGWQVPWCQRLSDPPRRLPSSRPAAPPRRSAGQPRRSPAGPTPPAPSACTRSPTSRSPHQRRVQLPVPTVRPPATTTPAWSSPGAADTSGRASGEVTVVRREGRPDPSFDGFGDDRFGGMASMDLAPRGGRAGNLHCSTPISTAAASSRASSTAARSRATRADRAERVRAVSPRRVVIDSGSVDAEIVDQLRDEVRRAGSRAPPP